MLCPVYAAGEKVDNNFSQDYFSQLIAKKSGIQVINIKNRNELKNFLKKNLFDDEISNLHGSWQHFKLDKRNWRLNCNDIDAQIENIKNKISGKISFNESLSKLSWFNLGGPAKVLFRPKNLKELSIFLKEIKEIKELNEIKVLGAGSNTLIRDGGFNGIIIKFGKSFLSHISI